MKGNSALVGVILGVLMIVLHFFPWVTTETQNGSAFSEGMGLVLRIQPAATLCISVSYLVVFLLLLQKKSGVASLYKICGTVLSLLVAVSVILNMIGIANMSFGILIVGVARSFGFGEKLSAGFGLYLLLAVSLLGMVTSLLHPSKRER